jgi:hypothetical protein
MLDKEISRKQFLGFIGAFFAFFMLSRLPLGGGTKTFAKKNSGSYGNNVYGGKKGK